MKKISTSLFILLTLSAFCVKGMSQQSVNVYKAVEESANIGAAAQAAAVKDEVQASQNENPSLKTTKQEINNTNQNKEDLKNNLTLAKSAPGRQHPIAKTRQEARQNTRQNNRQTRRQTVVKTVHTAK